MQDITIGIVCVIILVLVLYACSCNKDNMQPAPPHEPPGRELPTSYSTPTRDNTATFYIQAIDPMSYHKHDINADGKVTVNDLTMTEGYKGTKPEFHRKQEQKVKPPTDLKKMSVTFGPPTYIANKQTGSSMSASKRSKPIILSDYSSQASSLHKQNIQKSMSDDYYIKLLHPQNSSEQARTRFVTNPTLTSLASTAAPRDVLKNSDSNWQRGNQDYLFRKKIIEKKTLEDEEQYPLKKIRRKRITDPDNILLTY